jgi:hypothetical protein
VTLLLLPGNAKRILALGLPLTPDRYGWLLTPAHTMTTQGLHGLPYAIDNEVYTGKYHPSKWTRNVKRMRRTHGYEPCLFTVAPDVVADAAATLASFHEWEPWIHRLGLPVALAAQDGIEHLQDHIPWDRFEALFIGGTTAWKLSEPTAALMYQAHQRGKWVHAARVNSRERLDAFRHKPDSIDGTHWTRRPDRTIRAWHRETEERRRNRCFPFYETVPTWQPEQ